MKNFLKLALTSLVLFSCTKTEVRKQRYVEPNWAQSLDKNEKEIEIFATNRLGGALTPQQVYFSPEEASPIRYGGASLLLAYNLISKEKNKNTVWLDLGNSFDPLSGPIHLETTSYFLAKMNYDAIAFTEKELAVIGTKSNNYKLPFIISNMIDLSTGQTFSNESIKPWKVIEKNGLKVGLISVTNYNFIKGDEPSKTRGLFFEDMVLSILRAKREFAKSKVDFTILMTNIDSGCHLSHKKELACPNEGDDLKKLIERIPPDTINLVLASPNRIASGLINNIPTVLIPGQGKWLSRVRLIFKNNNIENVEMLEPIRICDKIFHDTNDCHFPLSGEESEKKRLAMLRKSINEIKPAKFWGHEIIENIEIEESFKLIRTQGTQAPLNK